MTATTLTSKDIRGVVGIIPTPSIPGADRPDAVDTVDLDETVRMTEAIVESGIDVLMTNGTFGEAATLTLDELLAFNDAVISTVGGRIPVISGATTLNTRETITRGKALRELGADGLFVGRPMWLPMDSEQIVAFYRAIADALAGAAIVAYDNPGAFKGKIAPAAYAELATIPQIVASKHTGGLEAYSADLRAVEGRIVLLPTLDTWYPWSKAHPGEVLAAWSGDVACGPEPAIALRDALRAGDDARAKQIHDDIAWASETLFPDGDVAKFMPYSIQIDRAEFEAAGYITPGPARLPYTTAPASYLEGGAEVGRRWAQLSRKYIAAIQSA